MRHSLYTYKTKWGVKSHFLSEHMIDVIDLNKSFYLHDKKNKLVVNNNINVHFKQGSLIWIFGNSGSGKSTFLNSVTGVHNIDSGIVKIDGFPISDVVDNEKSIYRLNNCGLVFQFFELIKSLNAYANASIPLQLLKKNKRDIEMALNPLFEVFDIEHIKQKKPKELSGGEKQRVAIIRALCTSPRFLFADEITASLDMDMSSFMYGYLRKYIKRKNGVGVFVSHDPVIKNYIDEIYEMKEGKLIRCDG